MHCIPLPPTSVLSLGEQGSSGKRTKGNEQEAHGRNNEAALLQRAVVLIYSKLVIFSQKCSSAQSKMIWSTSAAECVKHFVMKPEDWRSWENPKNMFLFLKRCYSCTWIACYYVIRYSSSLLFLYNLTCLQKQLYLYTVYTVYMCVYFLFYNVTHWTINMFLKAFTVKVFLLLSWI